jgi:hypothetical protein
MIQFLTLDITPYIFCQVALASHHPNLNYNQTYASQHHSGLTLIAFLFLDGILLSAVPHE